MRSAPFFCPPAKGYRLSPIACFCTIDWSASFDTPSSDASGASVNVQRSPPGASMCR